MVRYKKERVFNYPVDKCVELFFENPDGAYKMDELENVTEWKVINETDDGDKRVGTKEWCGHGQIPKVAQHIVSPKMLTWLEHSV